MKTTLFSLLVGFSFMSSLAAQEQPKLAVDDVVRIIVEAIKSAELVKEHSAEWAKLLGAESSNRPRPAQVARLKELRAEQVTSFEATAKVIALLRVGESTSSYPGLFALAVGPTSYDAEKRIYSIRLLKGYSSFELGVAKHPNYFEVSFDMSGRITEMKSIRTADMVTH